MNRLVVDNTKAKEILKWEPIFPEEMAKASLQIQLNGCQIFTNLNNIIFN